MYLRPLIAISGIDSSIVRVHFAWSSSDMAMRGLKDTFWPTVAAKISPG